MKKVITLLFTLCFLLTGAISGCTGEGPFSSSKPGSHGEGFAIYLTRDDVPPSKMPALSHIELADKAIISSDDIIAYNAGTHDITLTADACERILRLHVPVNGRSFVVCVNREPVYWGAFWIPISSLSFDGIVIMILHGTPASNIIKFEPGYPSPSFYTGDDPRNNAEIMESLRLAGKLTAPSD